MYRNNYIKKNHVLISCDVEKQFEQCLNIHSWTFFQISKFSVRDLLKYAKRHTIDWEKVVQSTAICNKGLVSRLYKEVLKVDNNKMNVSL